MRWLVSSVIVVRINQLVGKKATIFPKSFWRRVQIAVTSLVQQLDRVLMLDEYFFLSLGRRDLIETCYNYCI